MMSHSSALTDDCCVIGLVNLIQPIILRSCCSQNAGLGRDVADCLANAIKKTFNAAGDVSRQL